MFNRRARSANATASRRAGSRSLVVLLLGGALTACGGRGSTEQGAASDVLPEVCERYLDVYGACMHRLLPQGAELADARVANARASLGRLSGTDQLRDVCVNGTTQLRASCQ